MNILSLLRPAVLALGLAAAAVAHAAPVTWNFRTVVPANSNTTFGTGYFTYDDSLGTGPGTNVLTPNILDFAYSDPIVGSFTEANLSSFQFSIVALPTPTLFTFVAASPDNLRSFNGGAQTALNNGGISTSNNFSTGGFSNNVELLWPELAPIPEPQTYALLALGLLSLAAVARRKRA